MRTRTWLVQQEGSSAGGAGPVLQPGFRVEWHFKASSLGPAGTKWSFTLVCDRQVWSIQRGRRINAGAVQGKFAQRIPPATPRDEAAA